MTVVLFLLALGLLSVGAIGGTQAALNIRSNDYYSAFDLDHIGVALLNGDTQVAYRTFTDDVSADPDKAVIVKLNGELRPNLGGDKEVKLGKRYSMPITVQNTGTIDQYVRVTIRKYWVAGAEGVKPDEGYYFHGDGTKIINEVYLPAYIQLGYNGGTDNFNNGKWIWDPSAHTDEREVYYYNGVLAPGEKSAPLIDNVSISTDVTKEAVVTETTTTVGGVTKTKTVYTYAYEGYGFVVIAEVDAIQTHHARAAMTSAWGTSSAVMTAIGIPNEA